MCTYLVGRGARVQSVVRAVQVFNYQSGRGEVAEGIVLHANAIIFASRFYDGVRAHSPAISKVQLFIIIIVITITAVTDSRCHFRKPSALTIYTVPTGVVVGGCCEGMVSTTAMANDTGKSTRCKLTTMIISIWTNSSMHRDYQ